MVFIMFESYNEFLKQGIDLAPLGMERTDDQSGYFCTPKGARIIGRAGVDGIHFCFVEGFGETVFAVSPMNIAPDFVHPIAKCFGDLLRPLLACGDIAAPEQTWQWTQGQFDAFIAENKPTAEQKKVLSGIRNLGYLPMEQPWQYMKSLRETFDYGALEYPEELEEEQIAVSQVSAAYDIPPDCAEVISSPDGPMFSVKKQK